MMAPRSFDNRLQFGEIKAMTFDCYGTLIDWETGLLKAIQPILDSHGVRLSDSRILQIYGEIEPEEQNPYRLYREVLANIVRRLGERLGFVALEKEAEALPNSLPSWLPFPDTNQALEKLKTRYKLAIVSNTDDAFFAATSRHFGVQFDEVITAEQAKAYKPSLEPFRLALHRLGLKPEQVLHAGQSIHHDVLPAKSLGLSTVLVYRRGFGATRPTSGEPDLKVPDMKTLADLAVR